MVGVLSVKKMWSAGRSVVADGMSTISNYLLIRHKEYIMGVKLKTKKEQIHHGKILEHD